MTDELNFEPQTETEPIKGGGGGFGGGRPPRKTRVGTGGDDEEELRDRVLKIYQMLKMSTGNEPTYSEIARQAQLSERKVGSLMDSILNEGGQAASVISERIDYLVGVVQAGLITKEETVLAYREAKARGNQLVRF